MRRAGTIALGALIALGGVVALMAVFSARDEGNLATEPATAGPGELQPDRGRAHRAHAAAFDPADPVASGTHRPLPIARDRRRLGADRLLHALELGNVVLLYGEERPPAALVELQERVAGPFDAEVAAAGQAVILARGEGLDDYVVLAWRRVLRAQRPSDPALREFAEVWLGRGA